MQSYSHHEPDLVEQYHSILSPHSIPTPSPTPEPITFIQHLLSINTYPSCRLCSICLMNQSCLYQDSHLLCHQFAATHRPEPTSVDFSTSEIYRVDLSQKLKGSQQWSLGDHLELMALLEANMRSRYVKCKLLKLGERMFNKKDSLQVLQYLREQMDKNTSTSLDLNLNHYHHLDQNLVITFDCLNEQHDQQQATTVFKRYQAHEDSTIRTLFLSSNTTMKSSLFRKMALYEAETSIKIYKQILRLHQQPKDTKPSLESIKSNQVIEDITSTNQVGKNSQSQIELNSLNEKQLKEKQLLDELSKLIKKGKVSKKKKIRKERAKYVWY